MRDDCSPLGRAGFRFEFEEHYMFDHGSLLISDWSELEQEKEGTTDEHRFTEIKPDRHLCASVFICGFLLFLPAIIFQLQCRRSKYSPIRSPTKSLLEKSLSGLLLS